MNFSQHDLKQITDHGLTPDDVQKQLADFARGFPYADITAAATIDNGIIEMTDNDRNKYIDIYEKYRMTHKIVKFVPASGAATRMFRDLFEFITTGTQNAITDTVLARLSEFAFYDDLKQYLAPNATDSEIISCILTTPGLNYGKLPKGLLAFHKYNAFARTPVEEHLAEGDEYARGTDAVNIEFTVSPEHIAGFDALLARVVPEYEQKYDTKYNVKLSTQKPSTDTIAVNPDNTLFRTDDGELLFRPAGHGALIENLNEIDADIIFIKNIDNVCTASQRNDTIEYKRALAGILVSTQETVFKYIRDIDNNTANIDEIYEFIKNKLGTRPDTDINTAQMRDILNRPIRVCGVVRNTGAPGGGPFWTRGDKCETLQIVESAQIAPDKRDIMNTASHFNPVDLVCGVRDYLGHKFDLTKYIDSNTGFISEKSSNGRALRAMERPGLWNGAMAEWNTIFVQVPATTFTPVKTVDALLDAAHREIK